MDVVGVITEEGLTVAFRAVRLAGLSVDRCGRHGDELVNFAGLP